LIPYRVGDRILLDVQQIIPLPEATDLTIRLRRRETRARSASEGGPDWTPYVIITPGDRTRPLRKRQAILAMVQAIHRAGVTCKALRLLRRHREEVSASNRSKRDGASKRRFGPRFLTDLIFPPAQRSPNAWDRVEVRAQMGRPACRRALTGGRWAQPVRKGGPVKARGHIAACRAVDRGLRAQPYPTAPRGAPASSAGTSPRHCLRPGAKRLCCPGASVRRGPKACVTEGSMWVAP
jgi:hypothetical protein